MVSGAHLKIKGKHAKDGMTTILFLVFLENVKISKWANQRQKAGSLPNSSTAASDDEFSEIWEKIEAMIEEMTEAKLNKWMNVFPPSYN